MANCQENSCNNVQSAICLHCNNRLCAPHITAHGTALLQQADELCEQINQLTEHLNVALEQIHTTHNEALDAVNIWRQKQIDQIENKYAEKVQGIESRQDYLIELDHKLSQQLVKDVREPLIRMQTQKSANSELIQQIRQAIANIMQQSTQLDSYLKQTSDEILPLDVEKMTITTSPPHQPIQSPDQNQHVNRQSNIYVERHASTNSFANQWYQPYQLYQPFIQSIPRTNTVTNVPYTVINSSGFSPFANQNRTSFLPYQLQQPTPAAATAGTPFYQAWSPPTTTATASPFVPLPQNEVVVSRSPINIKSLPNNSSKRLKTLFLNVSGSGDHLLNEHIIRDLNRAVHVNNMMVMLLSFLEAWHTNHVPTVFNERVLSYHIFTVQRYINGRDHELTVIAAILVFIKSCNYDEMRSGRIMLVLLQHFFDHKCITKAIVLDWYVNGATYGYNNFQQAKLWAKPFLDQLDTDG